MPRQKVEYAPNLPTIIELDGPGMPQPNGRGEEEYRYMLVGDRITWVPPAVHAQIEASGADYPGAVFSITKHQLKARAPITWEVQRITPPAGFGYANQPAPQPPPPQRQPARPTATPNPGYSAPQPAAQMAADAQELAPSGADRMAQALRDAIELWRGVSSMEPGLRWDAGDVRALAATLFIEGGRR